MARKPRPPRAAERSAESADAVAASRPVVARSSPGRRPVVARIDERQVELFATPFIPPCKPKLVDRLPEGERWQYEVKADGYRAQAHVVAGGLIRVYSKSGREMGAKLPGILRDLEALPVRSAVIDGEAVIVDERGISDWHALHASMDRRGAPDAVLFAFDLLHLDGENVRPKPLVERVAMLARLLVGAGPHLHLSEHHLGDGAALLKAACEMGLEGIVAKRRDLPYRSGERPEWLKAKCTLTDHFAAIGFDPHGRTGVRALRLARLVDGILTPCGSVGSGIGETASRALRAVLDGGQHVVAEVEHRGLSPAGELRHPVLKGWTAE